MTTTIEHAARCVKACEWINPEAVPELLAACEKVYLELDSLTGGEPDHPLSNYVGNWKAELRAAITKAKGGPQ